MYERRIFTIFLGMLTAISPLAIEIYLPLIPTLTKIFNTDIHNINMSVTAYVAGNAVGQFLGGAFSDQLGRRKISLFGLILFCVFSLVPLFITDIHILQLSRLIQGIGGGFLSGIVVAIIIDIYDKPRVPKKIASVTSIMLIAPLMAPIIGATLLTFGWYWVFIFMVVFSGVLLWFYWRNLPETLINVRHSLSLSTMVNNYRNVIVHRDDLGNRTVLFGFIGALVGATFMTYIVNGANLMMNIQGLSPLHFSLLFMSNGIALLIGNRFSNRVSDRIGSSKTVLACNIVQIVTIFGLTIHFLIEPQMVATLIGGLMIILVCHGAIMVQNFSTYMGHFSTLSGSASSLYRTTLTIAGAVIASIVSWLSIKYDSAMLVSMCTTSSLAFVLILNWRKRDQSRAAKEITAQ